jgi:hypothetical protein
VLFLDMLKQPPNGLFHGLDDGEKFLRAIMVRVRNLGAAHVIGVVVHQKLDFAGISGRLPCGKAHHVLAIHGNDVVEAFVVFLADLAGNLVLNLVTEVPGCMNGARIRILAHVKCCRSAGVDQEKVRQAEAGNLVLEDSLRTGRAADVPEADKKNADFFLAHGSFLGVSGRQLQPAGECIHFAGIGKSARLFPAR